MNNTIKIKVSEETFKQLDEMSKKAKKKMTKEDFVRVAVDNYYTAYRIGEAVKEGIRSALGEEDTEEMEKEFNERNEKQDVEKSEN